MLENIELQVRSNIRTAGLRQLGKDQKKIVSTVREECERVKLMLKKQFLAVENEQMFRRCFSFHQQSLIFLIDHCATAGINKEVTSEIANSLVDLLGFFEHHFPLYFDSDQKPPDILVRGYLTEIGQAAEVIALHFSRTALDSDLLGLVIKPIKNLEANWSELTYRKLYFFRALKAQLVTVDTTSTEQELLRQDFCRALIKVNFNTEKFFQFYVTHITKCLATCETLSDRIDLMSYFYKICTQEQCLQNAGFIKQNLSINVQLSEWISLELEHLRNKQLLRLSPEIAKETLTKDFKLNFDLSVSHLALLFRAFIETGVIQNKNASELIRFLTKFVKTKKSEAVSYDSFRIKFYNAESGTKDAVKKTLMSMLQYINKN